ncbi:MAG: DUF3108 domain-containing protein [Thermodesulfobacteriota bacterium]|nr:DUF3108 domain-containing protein [Thermodesulfobacteriota bacterium]
MSPPFRIVLACALLLALVSGARAERLLPFRPGERLVYSLRWGPIPAGRAVLEVLPMETILGTQRRHFRMHAKTNAFVDIFYKVRDQVDAYTDQDLTYSVLYRKKQREGSYKRDITVTFNQKALTARYENIINGPKKPIKISPGTFDPLSVFYSFRLMELYENATLTSPVTDGTKFVMGEARVVGKERITVPAGEFETFLVEPDLRHLGGVFKKSKNAKLKIWVTADKRRIPVKIKSKVAVGHFNAVLVESRL